MNGKSTAILQDVLDEPLEIADSPEFGQRIRQILTERPLAGSVRTNPVTGPRRLPEDLD